MTAWIGAVLLAAAALAASAGAGRAQETPEQVRERAYRALEGGDLPAAAQMLQELGDSGVAQGYTILGEIKRDLGDYSDAARWFERGAAGGDTSAMIQGGTLLGDPEVGPHDPRRAFHLWIAAAEKGVARGQYEAGVALMQGRGTRKDPAAGADWLEKAAKQCQADAQVAYALVLRQGRGREADGEEAFAWLIAAERAKEDWTEAELEELATMETEIPAYMSSEQVKGAYCRGLDHFAEACGSGSTLFRIERWYYCR